MKRFLSFIVVLAIALSCTLFVACGHEHTWSSEWSFDSSNHWKECTSEDCNEVSGMSAHTMIDGNCSVCEYHSVEYYKVSDEDWASAFAFGSNIKVVEKQTFGDGSYTTNTLLYASNGLVSSTQLSSSSNYDQFTYFEFDGAKVYAYDPVRDQDSGELYGYKRIEQPYTVAEFMQNFGTCAIAELGDKSKYTFNATTCAYEIASITIGEGNYAVNYSNVSVKFADGDLLSFTYSAVNANDFAYTGSYTVTRDAVITFPALYIERTVTEQEWNNALNLFRDGNFNLTANYVSTHDGTDENRCVFKTQRVGNDQKFYFNDQGVFSLEPYEKYYSTNDNINFYEYNLIKDVYFGHTSTLVVEDLLDQMSLFVYYLDMGEFEYENGAYVAETAYLYDEIGAQTGEEITDARITFVNGVLETIQYYKYGYSCEINYEYGNTTVTLPQNSINFGAFIDEFNNGAQFTKEYYAKQYSSFPFELLTRVKRVNGMQIQDLFGTVGECTRNILVIDGSKYYFGWADVPVEEGAEPVWPATITVSEKTEYKYNQYFKDSNNLKIRQEYLLPSLDENFTFDATTNTYTDKDGNSIRLENGKIVEVIVSDGYYGSLKYVIDYSTPVFDQDYVIG